jgi:hypothetical protein
MLIDNHEEVGINKKLLQKLKKELIPDPIYDPSVLVTIQLDLDLGSVINDCGDKHYNTVGA